jgi:hypothetical protein
MDAFAPYDFSVEFAALTPEGQQEVLRLMQQLRDRQQRDSATHVEVRRKTLLELASTFTKEDIEAMKAAEAECEQIDADAW